MFEQINERRIACFEWGSAEETKASNPAGFICPHTLSRFLPSYFDFGLRTSAVLGKPLECPCNFDTPRIPFFQKKAVPKDSGSKNGFIEDFSHR